MEKRRRNDQKWYLQSVPSRNLKNGVLQGASLPFLRIPRMTISRSQDVSLMNRDRLNNTGSRSTSRSTSRASQVFDLSGSFRHGGSFAAADIEDILTRNPGTRPRSINLIKYDPLPAINSDQSKRSSASQDSRDLDLSSLNDSVEEEFEEKQLLEQLKGLEEESQASANVFVPPKLVRSRTFDVIETNLTNLPVIEEGSNDHDSYADDNRREVVITINGTPLQDFISQAKNAIFPVGSNNSELFGLDTRPSSRSSLVTHPGTPDSGFGAPTFDGSSSRSNLRSSRSLVYQLQETPESEANETATALEHGLYIRFPNDTLIFSNGALNETLGDFLNRIENMKYEGKKLKIRGSNVPDVDLEKKLRFYGITEDVTIHLLPES